MMKGLRKRMHRMKTEGFTLIELVVAILVFALGIMGIMKMHSATVQSNNYSMQLTEAVNIGETQLEILRGLDFTTSTMSVGAHNTTTARSRGIPYNVSYTVTNPGTSTPTRNVALSVTWQEKNLNHRIDMNVRWDEFNPR
jgi:type IV pilus assembly protein PilV